MRMLIMGPPGAGKGTQAQAIAEHYGVKAISSGDIFRRNIKEKTAIGLKIAEVIAAGEYVSDDLTNALMLNEMALPEFSHGYLLDGYPRTVGQVEFMDLALKRHGNALDVVISLVADPEELVGRLLKRAEIEGRADDNEETIRRRLEVYRAETAELMDIYRAKGLLVEVDAIGTVDEVRERLFAAVDAKLGR